MNSSIFKLVAGLLFIYYAPTCKILAQPPPAKEFYVAISPTAAQRLVKNYEAVLVDVREEAEINGGLAAPAQWMPLSRMKDNDPMFRVFLNGLSPNQLIIFYCVGGKRARQAQYELEKRGFRTANMGGLSEWQRARLPLKKLNEKVRYPNNQVL